jgi:DNA gyrase subunit B/topoisomerase-4 subunit B
MTFPRGPLKLDDCQSHGPGSGAELFVVEGDSAADSVSRVRDAAFQAVLPMQGKPLNALKATARKVAGHPLYQALADAIGAGIGDRFDLTACRYERILLLMDPDADGIHCGVLMLMFFQRWMPALLEASRVELVRPPWGEVLAAGAASPTFAFSEPELQLLADGLRARGGVVARRYRGLAAIDARVLAATCIVPASRRTSPVSAAQAAALIGMLNGPSTDAHLKTHRPTRPRRR